MAGKDSSNVPENETPAILAFRNAAYGFGAREVLTDLTLRLEPGAFYFLTGPSGAGKTTFLKLCYLEISPRRGHIELFGRNADHMTRDDVALTRRRIGVIHQDCQFLDHLSVRENVVMPLIVSGRDPGGAFGNVNELLGWVGLTQRQDALPPQLSGGERQRAALARAVVAAPDLILADEPTGNVDWEMSERLLSLLIQLNRQGRTVVVATHDLPLIRSAKAQVPVRVLRLSGGHLTQAGADL